jgi:hypothetical protein
MFLTKKNMWESSCTLNRGLVTAIIMEIIMMKDEEKAPFLSMASPSCICPLPCPNLEHIFILV